MAEPSGQFQQGSTGARAADSPIFMSLTRSSASPSRREVHTRFLCYHCGLIETIKRFELRMLAVCMILLGSAAAWLLSTRPAHRIEGDFLEREDKRQVDDWLRERVRAPIGDTRRRTCIALGRIGDPQTLILLLEATKDPSPRVRAMAAFAIGQMEDFETLARLGRKPGPDAARALLALLGDRERGVVAYAVEALGKMRRREAMGVLLNTPAPLPVTLAALARMQAYETADWISELLRSDDQDVRRAAIAALNRLNVDLDEGLTKQMVRRVRDRNAKVRAVALAALARAESAEEVVSAVLRAAEDRNPQVRIQAYRALGALRPPDAAARLAAGLQDENPNVRIAAVRTLGGAGDRRALPLLQSLRFQADPLSYAAEEALARLASNDEEYFAGVDGLPAAYESEAGRESFLRALEVFGSPRAEALLAQLKPTDSTPAMGETDPPSEPRFEPADYQRISRELNRRLMVHTTIGVFELVIHYDEARLTAEHFASLAAAGAFGQQRFVAVEPVRLVEFLAARPDDPVRFPARVRCEINTELFTRGSLGMIADPRDSGGYRFFIALTDLPELDGRYTNFGRLVSGDRLISEITRETKILKVTTP